MELKTLDIANNLKEHIGKLTEQLGMVERLEITVSHKGDRAKTEIIILDKVRRDEITEIIGCYLESQIKECKLKFEAL